MAPTDLAVVRKFVFDYFLENCVPPVVEQLSRHFGLDVSEAGRALDQLEAARHLKLVPGTARILMAFPFSAVATPYRVTRANGSAYFANCAWDAVAFLPMLRERVRIDSYCAHCAHEIMLELDPDSPRGGEFGEALVYLGRPAASWWDDIISTCSNSMVFLNSEEHLHDWRKASGGDTGVALTIDQTVQLSRPIYESKFDLGYVRPKKAELETHFARLGLSGPFWKL